MPVYVDEAIWRRWGLRWCHLLADDIDELHRFAAALGVQRSSYQGPPKTAKPHYDITAFERDRALRLGAVSCTREAIVTVLRRVRSRDPGGAEVIYRHPARHASLNERPSPPLRGGRVCNEDVKSDARA